MFTNLVRHCINLLSYLILIINKELCTPEKRFKEFKLFCQTKTGKNQVEQLNPKFATNLIAWDLFFQKIDFSSPKQKKCTSFSYSAFSN